jgi:hypothetical protein
MREDRFDDVARVVASSTSRRQVLKIAAGATVGVLFARSGTALASNSACAHFCNDVFGEGTAAQSQCASQGAHHTGLCYSCGPNSPGGGISPSAICCTRNSGGHCTTYSSATCCPTGQTCQNGTCAAVCSPIGTPCPTVGPDSHCCSGQCGQFAGPGRTTGCCITSGTTCDISNPAACCSLICESTVGGGPPFVCG